MADTENEKEHDPMAMAYYGGVDVLADVLAAMIGEMSRSQEDPEEFLSRVFLHAEGEFRKGLAPEDGEVASYREGGCDLLSRMRERADHLMRNSY
jgi:hypothetical protein